MKTFGIIGNGKAAQYHIEAIKQTGNELVWIDDIEVSKQVGPTYYPVDYIVITSPTYLHRDQIEKYLGCTISKIIVEKPAVLPWQAIPDDRRINIVLQLRWLDLPDFDEIEVNMVRPPEYFKGWKALSSLTGGIIHLLFIHYIDLAIRKKAHFKGLICSSGENGIFLDKKLLTFNMQEIYNKMYADIIENDRGVKPRDLEYLNWVLNKLCIQHSFYNSYFIDKPIEVPRESL
jgi:hypothetical protein